jgi:NAD(P)-dependent dehydrogenase (short-subunit alcohol dehydrogenase family)
MIESMANPSIKSEKERKVALVTGATGAIGKAIARQIAAIPGYEVVLAVRNEARAQKAVEQIVQHTGNPHVRYELVDVSRQSSIIGLAERWHEPLHVLVNNAATTPRTRQETPEGIELQFATNVLGYFWMIQAFKEHLKRSAPARIVNVASYWAGDLRMDDMEFRQRPYRNGSAYRQSKQADRMLTVAFAERLKPFGISVNACHPGDVNSRLSNDLGFGGFETPDEGARTPVWLATTPSSGEISGKYFEESRAVHDRFAQDRSAVERLFEICSDYSQV